MRNLQLGKGPPRAAREGEGAPSAPRDYIGGALPPRTPPFFLLLFEVPVLVPCCLILGPICVELDHN